MHFDYDDDPKVALNNIKKILENEGFKIIEYAPEDGFLFTEYKEFNHTEKCEMGKVVISPADWAYSHRSQISHTKHKFIATGWVSIIPNMKQ